MKKLFLLLSMALGLVSNAQAKFDQSRFDKLLSEGKNILIHVHADWCPTCKVQKKVLDKLEHKNYTLLEVDFDKDKNFLKKYKLFQQSMLLSFSKGVEVKRVFGKTKEKDIVEFINTSFSDDSLQAVLDERKNSRPPSKERMTMAEATEKLRKSGILDGAHKKGDSIVDFTLPSATGKKVKLTDELKKGAVVLTFYRGGWCPYCNLQLKAYQEKLDEIEAAGGQLIAISPEKMSEADTTVKKNELKFEILSDEDNKIARKYGLVFHVEDDLKEVYLKFGIDLNKSQGNSAWELPIPATYVISKEGKIVYSFLNVDYVKRAEPSDIINALKSLK